MPGAESKGKKSARETRPSKKWLKYKVDAAGKIMHTGKPCPKCGSGVFLAEHKDRVACGKCHYTEFRKQEPKK